MNSLRTSLLGLPLLWRINLIGVVALVLAYAANRLGWLPLVALIGSLAFFIPSINAVATFERLSGCGQSGVRFSLWTLIFSLIITPAAIGSIAIATGGNPIEFARPAFLVWWALSFTAALVCAQFSQPPVVTGEPVHRREIFWLAGLFLLIFAGAAVIYPFIPEADGYTYLLKLGSVVEDPTQLSTDGRPLFTVLINLIGELTGYGPYWVLKLGLPLLGFGIVLGLHALLQRVIERPWLRVVLALTPIFIPVVFQELLISRPQSIFLLVLGPSLYLLTQLSRERGFPGSVYWLGLLLLVGLVGLKVHALFAFLILISIIGLIVFYADKIRRRPLNAAVTALIAATALYPWVEEVGIVGDLAELGKLFADAFRHNDFHWWFLDRYRNVDGNEVGWPGITAAFYYLYNLGLFLPGLVAVWLLARNNPPKAAAAPSVWPIWVMIVIFLVIAEVAPRFELAFLPDRAWLFVALGLAYVAPLSLARLLKGAPMVRAAIIGLAVASVVANWGLAHAKQGWIDPRDYQAGVFLKDELPRNAAILSQGGNHVLIRYYADRHMVRPPTEVVMTDDGAAVERYLVDQARRIQLENALSREKRIVLQASIASVRTQLKDPHPGSIELLETHLQILEDQYAAELENARLIRTSYIGSNVPVYFLYSRNKFDSIYGGRAWWQASNFYNAPLENFNRYPVVYNDNGVTIWEIRK